jgi:hypothetical protein
MNAVNRLEIMADAGELHKLSRILNQTAGVTYTVFRNVTSHGVRGEMENSGFSLENDYIIAFCPVDRVEALLTALQPILSKFGGACYVSAAQEMKSLRCINQLS